MDRILGSNSEALRASLLLCPIKDILTWLFRHSHFWNGRYWIGMNIIGSKCNSIFSYDKVMGSKGPCAVAELGPPHVRASRATLCPRAMMASAAPQVPTLSTLRVAGQVEGKQLHCSMSWHENRRRYHPIRPYRCWRLSRARTRMHWWRKGCICADSCKHHNSLPRQGPLISPFYRRKN